MSQIYDTLPTYTGERLRRVALPIGGIGTGTVSLGGRGDLRQWEICNRPAKFFTPANAFFAVWTKDINGKVATLGLEGPLDPIDFEGQGGCITPNHGIPRFRECTFASAYPFAHISLSDPDMPVSATLEAFNPLIPADSEASGLPIAVLRYTLKNTSGVDLDVAICGSLENFIGSDGTLTASKENKIQYRRDGRLSGLHFSSDGVDLDSPAWGTIALTTGSDGEITYRET